jgi:hypothetical protein
MRKLCVLAFLAVVLLAVAAGAGPLGDYGDAPDNGANFPSLYNTINSRVAGRRGPFHLDVSQEWLGPPPTSTTTVETDALLIDSDVDDAIVHLYFSPTSIPRLAWLQLQFSVQTGTESTPRYLNVLVDQNWDKQWMRSTLPEWVVVNEPLLFLPGRGLYVVPFTLPAPMFDAVSPVETTWVRITITEEAIDTAAFTGVGGWDGSGPNLGFATGETEDHALYPIPLGGPPPESLPGPDTLISPPPPPTCTKTAVIWGLGIPKTVYVPYPGTASGMICAKNKGEHPVHVDFAFWLPKIEMHVAMPNPPAAESTTIAPGKTACWPYTVSWMALPKPGTREPWDCVLIVDPPGDTIVLDKLFKFAYDSNLITWTDPDDPLEAVCDSPLAFQVWANHPDPDSIISLSADSLPQGASFPPAGGSNNVNGTFTWTPGMCAAGFHRAVFRAATATDTTIQRVEIYVNKLDRVPVVSGVPDSVVIAPGETLDVHVVGHDDDVTECADDMMLLSYSIARLPSVIPTFVDSGNGSAAFRWIPGAVDTGEFVARFLVQDLYYWGTGEFTKIVVGNPGIHDMNKRLKVPQFSLGQNSPNPFTRLTSIAVAVDREFLNGEKSATLSIYDTSGRLVKTLWSGKGEASVTWDGRANDGSRAISGVYLARLSAGERTLTRKMMLIR